MSHSARETIEINNASQCYEYCGNFMQVAFSYLEKVRTLIRPSKKERGPQIYL